MLKDGVNITKKWNEPKGKSKKHTTLPKWDKETRGSSIIYRNRDNPSLTYEIHKFDTRDIKEYSARYYHFPAKNGRGIPSSPKFSRTKKEAIKQAKKYIKKL